MIQKLREYLSRRTAVKSAFINSGWLIADRIIRLVGGLFIGVWIARYLAPDHFGIFNTLISTHGIALTLCGLGFESIITRYFIRYPRKASIFLGTTVAIRSILGIIVGGTMLIFVYFFPYPNVSYWIWILICITLCLTSFTALRQYYDARGESKYIIIPELCAFGISSGLRIIGILYHFSLEWFASIVLFEGLIGLIGYHWLYWRKKPSPWKFHWPTARVLFRQSWPILLTSGAAIIYFRIDQIMLLSMSGSHATGVYSAAARISEIAYFLPTITLTAVLPALTKLRKADRSRYLDQLGKIFSIIMGIAYFIAIITTIFASSIISILYGEAYSAAAPILMIHIWSLVWLCNSVIGHIYFTNEGLTRHYLFKDAISALMNVGLNFLLIPRWGGVGAATATFISYSFMAFFANAIIPPLRPLFKQQLYGLYLGELWRKYK